MATGINTTEYMYCSARIRALESSLFSSDKLFALMDCNGILDAAQKLEELGVPIIRADGGEIMVEETLESFCKIAWEQVISCTPAAQHLNFLRYPYDCINLKAVVKCHFRGISPESMLYSYGSVSAEHAMVAVSDASSYPKSMAAAVGDAMEAYAKTKNPQSIDVILDKACYKDMLECAKASGCGLSLELVKLRIDLTNIITCVRLIRMRMGGAGKALLLSAIIEGGRYDERFFCEAYDEGEDGLCEKLAFSHYDKFVATLRESGLSAAEKYADDMYMELARSAKMIPFGPEVAIGYLVAVENQSKNLRIILDSKATGKSADEVRERLRCSYV